MSKNRLIVPIAALLVVLAVLALANRRNGGDEVEELIEEQEAS